jgi:hypothetical protein
MLPRLLDYSRKRRRTFKVPMPQNKRLQVRRDWSPNWPSPGIPLFSGLFDRCKIGVVFIACALRARVRVAAFTRELARRLRGTGVTANCLHPGFVATRFADESGGLISRFAGLAKLLAISPEKGAETIIYLASSPKIAATTGRYFYKCRPIAPSREAQDDRTALSLWERSAALAGLNA